MGLRGLGWEGAELFELEELGDFCLAAGPGGLAGYGGAIGEGEWGGEGGDCGSFVV